MNKFSSIDFKKIGRIFFAIAVIGIGIEHFIFGDFMIGRAPGWPDSLPGRVIWAYLSGVLFVGIGLTVIFNNKARYAMILAAIVIFFWALLRNVSILFTESFLSGAWTNAGKALTFFGGALTIAATFPKGDKLSLTPLSHFLNSTTTFFLFGRICLGIFLVVTGFQHFIYTDFVASLIPYWFPGNTLFWTYFAGVALICGGIGLVIPKTTRMAALLAGVMVFSWLWIVHLPRIFLSVSDAVAVFEALAVSGIAFILAEPIEEVAKSVQPLVENDH